jgi:Co/Zn/Cd efflux system component
MASHLKRWWLILAGIAIFFWSSTEDNHVIVVSLLALNFVMALLLHKNTAERWQVSYKAMLWGALAGIATNLLTVGLMFFKTAWHSHIAPDFPVGMMLAMLLRLPWWALAGALVGVAFFALHQAMPAQSQSKSGNSGRA